MSGESSVRELRATGLQGVSLGETEIALVDGENGRLIYRGSRRRATGAREHLRGHGLPALERAPARRRRARRAAPPRGRGHGRARPRCTTRSARSAPARCRWTSCARGLSVWGAMRAPRRGRRQRGRPLGARRDAGDRRRLRAPALPAQSSLAPDPELGIVENYMLKLSGERPEAGAGPRARRVLHPRRRARHERLDVHGARDRLDALRPRPRASSAPSARSRGRCTAARRATSRT